MENNLSNFFETGYIKSAIDAGTRSRRIIFLILLASVVSFVSAWNSRGESWNASRISKKLDNYINIAFDSAYINSKSSDSLIVYHKAIYEYENAKKLYSEAFLIKIPIVGSHFDINDLGIFSGLCFTILLILFWYSSEREKINIDFLFLHFKNFGGNESKSDKNIELRRSLYIYLSMNQVLTMTKGSEHTFSIVWRYIAKFLYFLPFFVQLFIFYNDLSTLRIGFKLNYNATILLIILSTLFMIIILVLTLHCIRLSLKLDDSFDNFYEQDIGQEQFKHLRY